MMKVSRVLAVVVIATTIVVLSVAAGIRQAFWVAAGNFVSLVELRKTLSADQAQSLADAALDENIVWLRKYGWAVLPSELEALQKDFRALQTIWSSTNRFNAPEWKELKQDSDWISTQRENTLFLQKHAR